MSDEVEVKDDPKLTATEAASDENEALELELGDDDVDV